MGDATYALCFNAEGRPFLALSPRDPEWSMIAATGCRVQYLPRSAAFKAVMGSSKEAVVEPTAAPTPQSSAATKAAAPEKPSAPVKRVLGIDPGFAHLGWAVVELGRGLETLVAAGVVRTEKSEKKRGVLAPADNANRARLIAAQLRALVANYDVKCICRESESFVRNASAAAKVARGLGVQDALAELLDLPLLEASPQEIKLAFGCKKNASKEQVERAAAKRVGGIARLRARLVGDIPHGLHEHSIDAYGAVVACLQHDVIRLLRSAA